MKKMFMAFAMAFAMIAAPAALAQNPEAKTECNKETCKKENCKKDDCKKDKCKKDKCKKGDKKKGDKKKGPKQCGKDCKKGNPALKGITLTAEQQAKVDKINADLRAQREKQMKEAKERQQKEMDKYNDEIMKVLTPEQQAVYKQNVEKMKADRANGNRGDKRKGERRPDRVIGNPNGQVNN